MGINATLFGQIGTFAVFVFVMMKFIWPWLNNAIEERQKTIADGLASAEQAKKDLVTAKNEAKVIVDEAREKAGGIVDQAKQQATKIVDEAKQSAVSERQRQLTAAAVEIANATERAKETLKEELAELVITGTTQLLQREIDEKAHQNIMERLVKELS